jgi:hypothetical protein
LLRFVFGQKIWHSIFFGSKASFKIFRKLLPKPKAAPSFSISEKLARYGSSALSVRETLNLGCWQRVCHSRPDSSLWFAQGSGSRFLPETTAIPSTVLDRAFLAALSSASCQELRQ